jgi:hypothetical protein
MMRYFLIVFFSFLLFTCSKKKDQIEKFIFDKKQINTQKVYSYTFYPTGKPKTKASTLYYYFNGVIIDSASFKEKIIYNKKGLISKIESEKANEYYFYDSKDSLIAKHEINSFGDTIHLEKNLYMNGELVQRINRHLTIKLKEDITKTDFRDYDTMYWKTNFEHPHDTLTISQVRDSKNKLENIYHTYYKNTIPVKEVEYAFLGEQEYLKSTVHYDIAHPNTGDFFNITPLGDTIGLQKTVHTDSLKVISFWNRDWGHYEFWFYNKKNRLIKTIQENYTEKKRDVFTYTYDSRGNCIEEINFTERILEEHN